MRLWYYFMLLTSLVCTDSNKMHQKVQSKKIKVLHTRLEGVYELKIWYKFDDVDKYDNYNTFILLSSPVHRYVRISPSF